MKKTIFCICLASLLAGCNTQRTTLPDAPATPPPAPQTIQVYKPTGSVQCGDAGTPAPEMALQLTDVGVSVSDAHCGHDGMMRIAQCGAPAGEIAVFSIAQSDLGDAQQLGFSPLNELPSARLAACSE